MARGAFLKVAKAAGIAGRDVALVNLGVKGLAKGLVRFVPGVNIALIVGDVAVAGRAFYKGMRKNCFESKYYDIAKKDRPIKIGKCEYKNDNIDSHKFIEMINKLANTVKDEKTTSNGTTWFKNIFDEVSEELI